MMKLVSIVAPTYNCELYIERFIKCIINQSYNNWELLLVDDGSTDSTVSLIEKYCKTDSRIKLIKREREPKNANTCRNIGIKNAVGDYLIIFDSDDFVEPFCLEQRVQFMDNNNDVDYASFLGQCASEQKDQIIKINKFFGDKKQNCLLPWFLSAHYPFAVWNNIYKKSCISDVIWDENVYVYQDFDFMVSCIIKGLKHSFSLCKQPDYYYCLGHSNSVSSNFVSEKKHLSTLYLFDKTITRLKSINKNNHLYIKSYYLFYLLHLKRVVLGKNINQITVFLNCYFKWFGDNKLFIKHLQSAIAKGNNITFQVKIYRKILDISFFVKLKILPKFNPSLL